MTSETCSLYTKCVQCPRRCGVNRVYNTNIGFCGEKDALRVASACLHFGEEPIITVHGGSGAVFLTGCALRCAFCQNYQISHLGMGREVSSQEFTRICLDLQSAGAENINIVTGSHCIPLLAEYLSDAKMKGLSIKVCWNSSGYESVETLELLSNLVDIWLPDLKTLSTDLSYKLFAAKDYPSVAKTAIKWMIKHSALSITAKTKNGVTKEKLESGVIVRHLFLPSRFEETADVLEWLKKNADGKAVISLMSQYTPVPFKCAGDKAAQWEKSLKAIENRAVNSTEDRDLRDIIEAYDFEYLFYQELSDDSDWLPDFSKRQSFPAVLAKTLWHWTDAP